MNGGGDRGVGYVVSDRRERNGEMGERRLCARRA